MKALVCDKCGRQILNGQIYYQANLVPNNNNIFKHTSIDICYPCADETLNKLFDDEKSHYSVRRMWERMWSYLLHYL